MKSVLVILAAILSAIYLINPTAGFIEFIPDNLPVIGNLDEATATAILLACARYFGLDLARFFGRKGEDGKNSTIDVDWVIGALLFKVWSLLSVFHETILI